jgi:hypothetical protein
MGTSKRNAFIANTTPGPGSYDSSKHKQASPGWKLGSATRGGDRKNDIPGPGTYNSPGKISTASPLHTFGTKSHQRLMSAGPGPGAYDPLSATGQSHIPPSYSFGAKTAMPNDKTKVPGPGTYDQGSKVMSQTSPGWRVGTAKRDGLYQTTETPGPGSYGVRPGSAFNKESGPKYGFGTANRDELNAMSKTLPGPGTYDFKGNFESPTKGTTLVPRRPDSAMFTSGRTPGPGAYSPNLTIKNSSPAYRLGSASRDNKIRDAAPGPGAYEPQGLRSKQNVRIGTSVRSPINISGTTPGPGTYEHPTKVGEGPKFVMNPKREDVASMQHTRYVPGPGAYSPTVSLTNIKTPGVRIGTSNRSDLYDTKANPGPGQYDVRGRVTGPKWGFGSDSRGKDYTSYVPGPGTYEQKSKIGDVPAYVYGNGPLKIQL